MGKNHIDHHKNILLAVITVFFLGSFPASVYSAASGCVTCHTNENMITDNLAKEETKKSALQAGAG